MRFEIPKLPLEEILRTVNRFNAYQAVKLQSTIDHFIRSSEHPQPPHSHIQERIAHYREQQNTDGEFEKIPFDVLQLAVANLNGEELWILRRFVNGIAEKLKAPVGNYAIDASTLYPDEDPEVYMPRLPDFQKRAYDLFNQAREEKEQGNMERFWELTDEAIRGIDEDNLFSFQLRVDRENMLTPDGKRNTSEIAAIWEDAADHFRKKGDTSNLISALARLAPELRDTDRTKALQLINEAIQLAEENELPTYALKQSRIIISHSNWSGFLSTFEEEVDYCEKHHLYLKQIDALLNLSASFSQAGDKTKALASLKRAEEVLNSLTEEDVKTIAQSSMILSVLRAKLILLLRAGDIKERYRNLMSSS